MKKLEHKSSDSFGERFASKLAGNNADMSVFIDGTDDDWHELLSMLEDEKDWCTDEEIEINETVGSLNWEYINELMQHYLNCGLDEKEMIMMVLDTCVENIESMIDTVDVFHLITAHRVMPSLVDVLPFELAETVGYTYDEYIAMCDDLDERINEVLEAAIDQSIGTVAAENNCF